MAISTTKHLNDVAADALFAAAVGSPRDNGSVKPSTLTSEERRSFEKIARQNAKIADPVVESLVDAGIPETKARGFAAEMRKRENAGVTGLALALPNPAGHRSVPPDLHSIRSGNMASFVGRTHKKPKKNGGPRDNRSLKQFNEHRDTLDNLNAPTLIGRPITAAADQQANPLRADKAQMQAFANAYLRTGGNKADTVKGYTAKARSQTRTSKTGKTYTINYKGGPVAAKKNIRNLAAKAIAAGQDRMVNNTGKELDLYLTLVPYAGLVADPPQPGGFGGGADPVGPVPVGPQTRALLTKIIARSAQPSLSIQTLGQIKALQDVLPKLPASARQPVEKQIAAMANDPANMRVIDPNSDIRQRIAAVQAALASNAAEIEYSDVSALLRLGGNNYQFADALAYYDNPTGATITYNRKDKKTGKTVQATRREARDQKAVIADIARNNPRHNRRHNVGGMDATTIAGGAIAFVGGNVVGALASDAVSKLTDYSVMGIRVLPAAIGLGLGYDAYLSHANRGMLFRHIPNVGIRYGLAAGLILPMLARGVTSWGLSKIGLGKVDSLLSKPKAVSGFGDIYDTAFEDMSGTGEYIAESGLGEYIAESGLGGFGQAEPQPAFVRAATAGLGGPGGTPVFPSTAGLGYFVAANGTDPNIQDGTMVRAASAGFGGVADGSGDLNSPSFDGVGQAISVADMRKFAGVGEDDDDLDLSDTDGMSDDDLDLEGLGEVANARTRGQIQDVVRMTPESAAKVARIAEVQILGRSQRVPGTFIVAIRNTTRGTLPPTGGFPTKPSSVSIPPAPGGQAVFRPAGVFAETVFGGRGFAG